MIASIYRYPSATLKDQKCVGIEFDKWIDSHNEKDEREITFMKEDRCVQTITFDSSCEPIQIFFMSDKGHTFNKIQFRMNEVIK